jgi:hypothetical protein
VELGRYLCEVRAGQYWRLENLKSFDYFLVRRNNREIMGTRVNGKLLNVTGWITAVVMSAAAIAPIVTWVR